MARTAMTIRTRPGQYSTTPVLVATPDAFDQPNGMTLSLNGQIGLTINNPTGGAVTVTVHSAADALGRTGDITAFSIPAGNNAILQEFPVIGWNSGGGLLMNIDASATGLTYVALQRSPGT